MKQIERLIARLVQLVEDSPGQMVTLVITIDETGTPICWKVDQNKAEGLTKSVV